MTSLLTLLAILCVIFVWAIVVSWIDAVKEQIHFQKMAQYRSQPTAKEYAAALGDKWVDPE